MGHEISDEELRRIRTWLDTPSWERCPEDLLPDDGTSASGAGFAEKPPSPE